MGANKYMRENKNDNEARNIIPMEIKASVLT